MDNRVHPKRRRWWIAGLFSYLEPGLGQVYNGEATKGLLLNFLLTTWGGIVFSVLFYLLKRPINDTAIIIILSLFLVSGIFHVAIIIDAIRTASKKGATFVPKPYNKSIIYAAVLLVVYGVGFSISFMVREHVLKPYRIPTASMEPTLKPGDYILSNQLYFSDHNPVCGDVVIFKNPKDERIIFIKRIAGIPGDTCWISDGVLQISGKGAGGISVNRYKIADGSNPFILMILGPDEYFMLGDNYENSRDSRQFGPVPRQLIRGKPMVVYFSSAGFFKWRLGRIGRIIR